MSVYVAHTMPVCGIIYKWDTVEITVCYVWKSEY